MNSPNIGLKRKEQKGDQPFINVSSLDLADGIIPLGTQRTSAAPNVKERIASQRQTMDKILRDISNGLLARSTQMKPIDNGPKLNSKIFFKENRGPITPGLEPKTIATSII